MAIEAYDAIVVGAGPAGAAAARLLAACSLGVLVVDRPGGPRRVLAESIPPSAQKILATLGMLPAVEDAGFIRWHGNTVWWADEAPRIETFAAGTAGYQVMRAEFDRRLVALARDAGATVIEGLVRHVDLEAHTVTVRSGGSTRIFAAPLVLDCSGRAGVIARQGFRARTDAAQTVGLGGAWQTPADFGGAADTHTLVASYTDGWAWSVPVAPRLRHVTVMVDPARTDLTRDATSREVYRREIAKVRPFAQVLASATLVDGPWGAEATPYQASRYADSGWLLVGDAASFIDPLSSFGVKKALASGWLAAIATHTALTDSRMAGEALAFFDRREREVSGAATAATTRFAAEAALRTEHPFWTVRAEESDALAAAGADPAQLARDPQVLAAFETLRRLPSVRFRLGPAARIGPRAAVRGRRIVMEDHVFAPAWPDGLRYLQNIDLVSLVNHAPAHTDVGELYAAFARTAGEAPLPDFLGALSVLVATGVLVIGSDPSS